MLKKSQTLATNKAENRCATKKVNTFNEHFYLQVELEQKKVLTNTLRSQDRRRKNGSTVNFIIILRSSHKSKAALRKYKRKNAKNSSKQRKLQ